jgi:hypothetical protein
VLKVKGFTSHAGAHAHLLKHVLRLTETTDRREGPLDPEGWGAIMPQPPLTAAVDRRRSEALAILRRVPGCVAGETGLTASKPCAGCQDREAKRVVHNEMKALLDSYIGVAQQALDSGFENPDRHGPRVVAYRGEFGAVVETVDARHVTVVGRLEESAGGRNVALITCYREPRRSLASGWLELARLRAAHRRAGTLIAVE